MQQTITKINERRKERRKTRYLLHERTLLTKEYFRIQKNLFNSLNPKILYLGGVWIWMKNQCLRLVFPSFSFLCTRITLFRRHYALFMYCSQDPQLLYSEKNIKNGSHDTIHIFKNYFATVFSVFSKISNIQMDSYKKEILKAKASRTSLT